ncbi:preprotein translocase subunit SecG [Parvibaculum sp.]|jgi:preprotein translocase subunit SecG|uniref:preprotein translocase subunit SecG n=1 Tax=Parvibaculum sp. TaxID=2024848 RepID=UPI001B040061|nr:preprotein translocase subunit SecG [Parvibaculum sp.]MBO6635579.1 preprotein translocase subunit SecG [Parvibaculum sp.]MBO6680377.1 preprotein translocase subunit SecG [Parvibaculum sp.]MBO6685593.1 preprotein translocase subunit SecG [Parvibaculum sp.]MBO6904983.1 preprotein translocase subunit SecG [Parvibaculum sp.]
MATIILIIHLMLAVALVATVLLQRSEGGALGIGGGGDGMMTGRGAGNVLTRATAVLAALFMTTSLVLGILAARGGMADSVLDRVVPPPAEDSSDFDASVPAPIGSEFDTLEVPPAEDRDAIPPTAPAEAPTDANADESPAVAPEPAEPAVPRAE